MLYLCQFEGVHLQNCLFAFLHKIVEEKGKKVACEEMVIPINWNSNWISLRFPIDSINGQNDIDLSTNELNKEVGENEQRNGFKWWFSCNTANKKQVH